MGIRCCKHGSWPHDFGEIITTLEVVGCWIHRTVASGSCVSLREGGAEERSSQHHVTLFNILYYTTLLHIRNARYERELYVHHPPEWRVG